MRVKLEPIYIAHGWQAIELLRAGFDVCWGPHTTVRASDQPLDIYWLNVERLGYDARIVELSGTYVGVFTVVRPLDE
jgi:hypothetical protein